MCNIQGNCARFRATPVVISGHLPAGNRSTRPNKFWASGTDRLALSVATKQNLLIIRVKTLNRWEYAEPWGTDTHTYPSKTVGDEETVGKRTDVRGHGPNRKPVLGI